MISAFIGIPIVVLGTIVLRGGGGVIDAPIEAVSAGGLTIGGDEPRTIGWDSVLEVTGERAQETAQFEELSDLSWRARLRLARGDVRLAAPLFEDLYARSSRVPGPTSLLIAEGVTRCRLAAGDQAASIEPWTTALAMRRAGWKIAGDPPLEPVIDESTGLIPALAPFFARSTGDQPTNGAAVSAQLKSDLLGGDAVASALFALYTSAVSGEHLELRDADVLNHPGVQLVAQMLEAQSDDGETRMVARAWLRKFMSEHEASWREAWCRMAVGRSLLLEESQTDRQQGIIELLHVPARFHASLPYLAGLGLDDAASALDAMGDDVGAAVLRQDLASLLPNHPLLRFRRDTD